jgi:nucleotide-binding universal stress UspA family protein/hemerythrin-like domain-containing protein
MYRHLMVPLDDSALSAETAGKAVRLARTLGAKVTFFHAQEDYGATSVGALQRVIAPADFNEGMAGEARAILAKAEAVAREAGVNHASFATTSSRPYEAILDVAEKQGCDLIFIASHGHRGIKGLMLGSQTQRVLQHATIPVLVSSIESNIAPGAMMGPLTTIGDEHRSLAAVVHGLEFLVRETREGKAPPPPALLHAIVRYVKEFPEKLHHPKEDAYLFPRLRRRTSEFDGTLAELERQHAEGHRLIDELEGALARYEAGEAGGFGVFAAAVEHFAEAQMQHMRLETKVILPATRQYLTAADWVEIDKAFAKNGDPRFAVDNDEEFRALFARILNLFPEKVVGGTVGS